jgi:hypothetical protein
MLLAQIAPTPPDEVAIGYIPISPEKKKNSA